jgi:endoglucanase Acf2
MQQDTTRQAVPIDPSGKRKGSYISGLYPQIALQTSQGVDLKLDQQIPKSLNQAPTKTDNLPSHVPTNQWFTPLAWQERWPRTDLGPTPNDPNNVNPLYPPFTEWAFAEPLTFKATPEGLALYHPLLQCQNPDIQTWNQNGSATDKKYIRNQVIAQVQLQSADPRAVPNITFGHSAVANGFGANTDNPFVSGALDSYTHWSAATKFQAQQGQSMLVTMVNGSPFVFGEFSGGGAQVTFAPGVGQDEHGNPTRGAGITIEPVAGTSFDDNIVLLKVTKYSDPPAVRYYGLFGATGSSWQKTEQDGPAPGPSDPTQKVITLTNQNGQGYCTLALLPSNPSEPTADTLALFRKYAYSKVTGTAVVPIYDQKSATVTATYTYTAPANPHEPGSIAGTLFGLLPHHWYNQQVTTLKDANGQELWYRIVGGQLKLGEGTSFTNSYRVPPLLWALPDLGGYDPAKLSEYFDQITDNPNVALANNSYYQGKDMAKWAVGAAIADLKGATGAVNSLHNGIKAALEDWFTATDANGQVKTGFPNGLSLGGVLYYDDKWGQLIPYPTDFGAARFGNDHVFHYGYFLRAAAEVARKDPQWAYDWGLMVDLIIRDLANDNPADAMFPFMKGFSLYQGMAYADGAGRLADGRNTESMSEAVNAWAALLLWVLATPQLPEHQDRKRLNWAAFLFACETHAAQIYRLDAPQLDFNNKTSGPWRNFVPSIVSLFWSGKKEFNTFFADYTGQVTPIIPHGILWIPLTAGSLFQSLFPDYPQANLKGMILAASQGVGEVPVAQWFDQWHMYQAMSGDPTFVSEALAFVQPSGTGSSPLDQIQLPKYTPPGKEGDIVFAIDAGNSKASTYWWVHNYNQLGLLDPSITADCPLHAVFITPTKRRTYVAHNLTQTSLTVRFSDGTFLEVPPGQMAICTSS